MSWVSNILGGTATGLVTGVAGAIDRFVETGEEKKAASLLVAKMRQNPSRWQAEINKIEAGHRSLFVAGWRPAIGWICAMALGWGWIIAPTLQFFYPNQSMPGIELGEAISLVMAMLGMGALRTYEKHSSLTG